jgi:hypothetical protein
LSAKAFEELLIDQRRVTAGKDVSATAPLSVDSLVSAR